MACSRCAEIPAMWSDAAGEYVCAGCHAEATDEIGWRTLPSRNVTDGARTYGAVTGGNGRSQPTPCPTCDLPTWDGLHANGHRTCFMSEVPGV